eukprot:jgi/Ulvmu1/9953/UM059_0001.1
MWNRAIDTVADELKAHGYDESTISKIRAALNTDPVMAMASEIAALDTSAAGGTDNDKRNFHVVRLMIWTWFMDVVILRVLCQARIYLHGTVELSDLDVEKMGASPEGQFFAAERFAGQFADKTETNGGTFLGFGRYCNALATTAANNPSEIPCSKRFIDQGASTIRVPVARYHSSHTRLGPRHQGVPMPPSPQTVQADDMPDAQRGQLTNDSTTEHAALPAGPQTPAILLAATPSVQQQSAENRPTAVASAMPQTSMLIQQTATPKLLTTGAAPPGLQCNPSTALPMPPVISAVRHHLPPSPPRAILRNAGTTANMPKQKVSAHVSAHESTSDTVRQEEDQNFLACKLDKLFHPKLLVKMDKSSLMRLCARCVLWFYDGVYIDTSLLACLKMSMGGTVGRKIE